MLLIFSDRVGAECICIHVCGVAYLRILGSQPSMLAGPPPYPTAGFVARQGLSQSALGLLSIPIVSLKHENKRIHTCLTLTALSLSHTHTHTHTHTHKHTQTHTKAHNTNTNTHKRTQHKHTHTHTNTHTQISSGEILMPVFEKYLRRNESAFLSQRTDRQTDRQTDRIGYSRKLDTFTYKIFFLQNLD